MIMKESCYQSISLDCPGITAGCEMVLYMTPRGRHSATTDYEMLFVFSPLKAETNLSERLHNVDRTPVQVARWPSKNSGGYSDRYANTRFSVCISLSFKGPETVKPMRGYVHMGARAWPPWISLTMLRCTPHGQLT